MSMNYSETPNTETWTAALVLILLLFHLIDVSPYLGLLVNDVNIGVSQQYHQH